MIFKAIEFAAKAHNGQYRKQTPIPYISHPIAVMEILLGHGCSEEVAVAAILHDVVEDTEVTFTAIEKEFGASVAGLVASVTEPPKAESWEIRKRHTLDAMQTMSVESLNILCADKLHNLSSIRKELARDGDKVWQRFSRAKEKQAWYFRALNANFNSLMKSASGTALTRQFHEEVERVFG